MTLVAPPADQERKRLRRMSSCQYRDGILQTSPSQCCCRRERTGWHTCRVLTRWHSRRVPLLGLVVDLTLSLMDRCPRPSRPRRRAPPRTGRFMPRSTLLEVPPRRLLQLRHQHQRQLRTRRPRLSAGSRARELRRIQLRYHGQRMKPVTPKLTTARPRRMGRVQA